MCRSMSKEKQRSRDALSNAVSAERQWENLSAARTGRKARRASEIPKPENFDELTDMTSQKRWRSSNGLYLGFDVSVMDYNQRNHSISAIDHNVKETALNSL